MRWSLAALPTIVWTQPLPGDPLRDFQVSQPLRFPNTGDSCDILLVHHLFSNSFGQPAVVEYEPPQNCGSPGTWAAIGLNITATSAGVDVVINTCDHLHSSSRSFRHNLIDWWYAFIGVS